MSKKIQIVLHFLIIIIALSLTGMMIYMMPECGFCGDKFCFGRCVQQDNTTDFVSPPTKDNVEAPMTNQNTTRLVETDRAGDDYIKKIAFIGDSRTVAYEFYEIDKSQIFAENSLTHIQALTKNVVQLNENKFTSIEEAVMVTAPDIMLINFGINGAGWLPDDEFTSTYEELLDQLTTASPNSIVIIESILPVSLDYEYRNDGISNERIDELNDLLYEIAKRRGFYYMAANEALKGKSNALDSKYSGDGLHFNDAAYAVLLEYIRTHTVIRQ